MKGLLMMALAAIAIAGCQPTATSVPAESATARLLPTSEEDSIASSEVEAKEDETKDGSNPQSEPVVQDETWELIKSTMQAYQELSSEE